LDKAARGFGNKTVPPATVGSARLATKLPQQQWCVWYAWKQKCPNRNFAFGNKTVPAAMARFVFLETAQVA